MTREEKERLRAMYEAERKKREREKNAQAAREYLDYLCGIFAHNARERQRKKRR